MKDTVISLSERSFILEALKKENRIDGRRIQDTRTVKVAFREQYGSAEVQYGRTRAYAAVSAEVVEPWPDRPTEGFFNFNVEFSPMANPSWEAGRPSPYAVEAQRIIERGLRDSNAIDTESLCIVAGEKVWSVRCDVHVMDDWGNVVDCAALATISALLHFRRPEVTVSGNEVTIHSMEERTPVPLSIHHIPICVSFGFFSELPVVIVDPELKEECVINGRMTITMNIHKELCGIQKSGGNAIMAASVVKCSKIAAVKTAELTAEINKALEEHWNSRKRKRDRVAPVGSIPDIPVYTPTTTTTPTPTPSTPSTPSIPSTPITPTATTTPKLTKQPQQPKEHIVPAKKNQSESGANARGESSKASFPSSEAKDEFENFAKSMATKDSDKSARKKARIEENDEEEDVIILGDDKSTAKDTKPKTSTKPKPKPEQTKPVETPKGKDDAVMQDVLSSWGAEEETTPVQKKEETPKTSARKTGDGKKKRNKEIISID